MGARRRVYLSCKKDVLAHLLGAADVQVESHLGVELAYPSQAAPPRSEVSAADGTRLLSITDLKVDPQPSPGAVTDWRTLYVIRWGMRTLLFPEARAKQKERDRTHDTICRQLDAIRPLLNKMFEREEAVRTRAALHHALGIDDALAGAFLLWQRIDIAPTPFLALANESGPAGLDVTQRLWAPLERPAGKTRRGGDYVARRFAVACLRAGIRNPEDLAMIAALEPSCEFGSGSRFLPPHNVTGPEPQVREQQRAAVTHWRTVLSQTANARHG